MFKRQRVLTFSDNIVLVEYMAEKMPVIELMEDGGCDLVRQPLQPVLLVAWQGDVERDYIFHFARMQHAIADRSARRGEAVKKCLGSFNRRAFKKISLGRRENRGQTVPRLRDSGVGHF